MTPTTSRSSLPRGWRLAVIGAVGLLAVAIGVAAGSFLLIARTAALGGGTAYVPASAPLYVEVRLRPSASQDAALRELLGRFPATDAVDLDRPLVDQLTDHIDELLADEGASVSWSADVAPWFDGRIGMAILEIPLDELAGPGGEDAVPSMVVMLGVTDAGAAASSIERILAEADDLPAVVDQIHLGVTIHTAADEGAYAVTEDQVLLAPEASDIVAALDAHEDGSSTLANAAEIGRLTAVLPADWLAFGIYDFADLVSAAITQGATQSPAMAEAFGGLLEHQPLRGAMALSAGGDRMAIDVVTDAPTGPFAVANEDRGLSAEVPADLIYYSEAGNLGATLAAMIEPMKDAIAGMPDADDELATMEAALGTDLEELVSWIDDGAIAIGMDGSEPYAGMVLVPNDVEAAERRLGQLASFAGLAALDPASGVTVHEAEIGSVGVTTIRWEDPDAVSDAMLPAPTGLAVQYAVTDDRAYLGLGETFVARALDLAQGDSLASIERFSASVEELGGPSSTALSWLDLAGLREAIERVALPVLGMDGASGLYEAEIRPWLLPLDRVVSVSRLEDGQLVQHSVLVVE